MSGTWRKEDEENEAVYSRLVGRHGAGHRAADWGSRESQELRFAVLCEAGIGKDSSVLDIGCGSGDFYGFLAGRGFAGVYTGIDITPAMVEAAEKRFPEARFFAGDIMKDDAGGGAEPHDFVTASGIFAKRPEGGQSYLHAMAERMFALCRKGAAFNSLSAWAPEKQAGEFYADPLAALEFCRTLTPWVGLRADYHNRDFTIYMYRSRRA